MGLKWKQSRRLKAVLRLRDGDDCFWCALTLVPVARGHRGTLPANAMTIDHVTPRARGGGDQPDNLVLACPECQLKRSKGGSGSAGLISEADLEALIAPAR